MLLLKLRHREDASFCVWMKLGHKGDKVLAIKGNDFEIVQFFRQFHGVSNGHIRLSKGDSLRKQAHVMKLQPENDIG